MMSLIWALRPLPAPPVIGVELTAPPARDEAVDGAIESLDQAAFAALIWNPPAAPERSVAGVEASASVPPPRLQFIGIVHDTVEDGSVLLRAALYDPDTDTLHLVASGERIGAITVAAIERGEVSLECSGRTTILALRDDADGVRR